jgi:hypothetical protein
MRAFRRPAALAALVLSAALVVVPPALSASPAGPAAPTLGALDPALRLMNQLARWLGGAWLDEGSGANPNGRSVPAPPGARPASRHPTTGARPDNGALGDPNGNPPRVAPVRP